MGFFSDSDEDKYGAKAVAKRKQALKMKEHNAFLKEKAAYESGADLSKTGDSKTMDKASAAAGLAQQAGVLPSDGAAGGAISGATSGLAFGHGGAVVGGIAGAVMGAASASAARKAHNAQIEAKKHAAIADIEEKKGKQISHALGDMGRRMSLR